MMSQGAMEQIIREMAQQSKGENGFVEFIYNEELNAIIEVWTFKYGYSILSIQGN